jgi:hypothetical protein
MLYSPWHCPLMHAFIAEANEVLAQAYLGVKAG